MSDKTDGIANLNRAVAGWSIQRMDAACRAFIRYLQRDNGCDITGKPCRDQQQCGCWVERENAIRENRVQLVP